MNSNKTTIAALLALLVVAGIYWFMGGQGKVKMAPVAEEKLSMAAYIKQPQPKDLAPFAMVDASGAPKDISALKGKVTLLNLWATWCAPCRKEMPELAKLQKEMGGPDFQVVELSEDLKGYQASADFLKQVGADNLTLYADQKATALDAVKAPGLPVTLLLNREGQEVGRLLGPAPWASDEAKAIIKAAIDVH
ncbi:TlpA family protein disulfide reductase [Aestuariivirga litoralis]|uniref:TlpA family protein disulfide reductase n=1 Tax=Aestuariivirga litoralis TaxID=2650924 RepID=UPI0018C55353|nr:TlpA disulfide reductase family protein [Aestuariivirga litoralis]MBG1233699.1 TlpA family protein disulfide reductase [Aestuariivirga litoralis]